MSDYWDHEEYGALEAKLEKQVATTRKWMSLHDEAVEREATLLTEDARKADVISHLDTELELATAEDSLKDDVIAAAIGVFHSPDIPDTVDMGKLRVALEALESEGNPASSSQVTK